MPLWIIPCCSGMAHSSLLGTAGTTWSPGFHDSPSGGGAGGSRRGKQVFALDVPKENEKQHKNYLNGQKFPFWIGIFVSKKDVQTLEQDVQRDDGIFILGSAPDLCEQRYLTFDLVTGLGLRRLLG